MKVLATIAVTISKEELDIIELPQAIKAARRKTFDSSEPSIITLSDPQA